MVSSNARERKKKVYFQVQTGNVSPFFSPLHLPTVSLSCSALNLLCSFSVLLENMAWIPNSELRGKLLP